jgi:hypothetical protein
MVGAVIARLWRRWWLPARVTDAELMALCHLQVHHLIAIAAAAPQAVSYNKRGRMWDLRRCLPAACRARR